MIAGTLALLDGTADEPLESRNENNYTVLDVQESFEYLDGATVQRGMAVDTVESTEEDIFVNGTDIEVDRATALEQVVTEWVADVTDTGFVVAERTKGDVPGFPFGMFHAFTGVRAEPAVIDTKAFVEEHDGKVDLWFTGNKEETDSDLDPNNVDMAYGRDANPRGGNVGIGFKMSWNGSRVRGVLYNSGYVAVYNSSWGPVQFARFVRDVLVPVARVPHPEEEEQDTLGERV